MTFFLGSSAFAADEAIPSLYTCDGENVSPALNWNGAPADTVSFALIMDDPDAPRGIFTHWLIFNLPAAVQGLPEAVPKEKQLANGATQGQNDSGNVGYHGPCPPAGAPHRYHFRLNALDTALNLGSDATKEQLVDAMQGHILAEAVFVGTYQRKAA